MTILSFLGEWVNEKLFRKGSPQKGFLFCHKEECEYISFMTILSFLGEWVNGEHFQKGSPQKGFYFVIKKDCEYISFMTILLQRIENIFKKVLHKSFLFCHKERL